MTSLAASEFRVPPHRALITISVMMATTMQAVDGTIANVAMPHMQASLSATSDQIAWVLTSYIVSSAIMIPLTGFLAVRFGRKLLFNISIVGFTVSSALCGIAVSLEEMVIFRTVQGLCGAALIPLSQAFMLDMYPDEERGKSMALWGIGVMVGPVLGPTLGGWLTEYYDWRWVFYINVPFGVASFIGLSLFAPETKKDTTRRFAGYGFAMLVLAVAAFQLMLDRGERADWFDSNEIITWGVLATVGTVLFLRHMVISKNPFVDVRIVKDRNFVLGTLFYFGIAAVMYTSLALQPVMMEGLMGFPVVTIGLLVAPRGIGMMVGMNLVGRLTNKVDSRVLMAGALLMASAATWELSRFNLYSGKWDFIWTAFVQGIGVGGAFVSVNLITYSTLSMQLRTEATSLANAVRAMGSSIGISLAFLFMVRATQINHARLAEQVTPFNDTLQGPAMPGMWDLATQAGRAAMDGELIRQAQMMAYTTDFQLVAIGTLLLLPLLIFLRPQKTATSSARTH